MSTWFLMSVLTLLLAVSKAKFVAQSDDKDLSCAIQSEESKISAGNIFALAQDSQGGNWYPARLDLNDETVTRLGGDVSFPYYAMGGISADPVNHFVSLIVENSVYTLSTITGEIENQISPNIDNLKFFQYDYVSGKLIAMYWDGNTESEHVVFVNSDGSIEKIVITSSCSVTNSARTMNYDAGIFYYIGMECNDESYDTDYLYSVDINSKTFDFVELSTSVSYINYGNNNLYSLARVIDNSSSFALAEIDVMTGNVAIVNDNAAIFEYVIISDNSIDEGNGVYIKFGDESNILELVSLETGEIVKTIQFNEYIGPITFEPICVCCILNEVNESNENEIKRRLIDFDICDANRACNFKNITWVIILIFIVAYAFVQ